MKTMKDALGALRSFMDDQNVDSREKRMLWDVLTALRGPDEEAVADCNGGRIPANLVKDATTAVIRDAVFSHDAGMLIGVIIQSDCEESRHVRSAMRVLKHFENHARCAFRALGLEW
jgi:hypothetical protein